MAENKKSFVLYADLIHTVDLMPSDKAGELFKHILRYVNDKNPVTDDILIKLTFEPIKQQLKRDLKRYEAKKTQWSEAGKRSAEVRNAKKKQRSLTDVESRSTDLTVNDNDNVNDNVYKYLKENIKEKIELFEMQNKKSFPDWNNFIDNFNNKVIEEKLDFDINILFARLKRLNSNWDKTPKKEKTNKKESAGLILQKKHGLIK